MTSGICTTAIGSRLTSSRGAPKLDKAVFDGRNQYRREVMAAHGLAYFSIGRAGPIKAAA